MTPTTSTAPAAADYKQMQRDYWGLAARGWLEWWHLFEAALQRVSDAMVKLGTVDPGHRVLDLATGIGEPAATAARRAGQDGMVVGTDLSPEMLAVGRERAERERLAGLEFRTMDAEWPDFSPRSFDTVLCRLGLMFLLDLSGTLERIGALLVPGGKFCAAVWGSPASCPFLTLTRSTVGQFLELPAPPPDAPGPFRLSAPGALEEALAGAGFTGIVTQRIQTTFTWSSPEEFTRFQQSVAAPVHGMLEGQSPELRAQAWKAVTRAAHDRAGRDGTLRLAAELVVAVGEAASNCLERSQEPAPNRLESPQGVQRSRPRHSRGAAQIALANDESHYLGATGTALRLFPRNLARLCPDDGAAVPMTLLSKQPQQTNSATPWDTATVVRPQAQCPAAFGTIVPRQRDRSDVRMPSVKRNSLTALHAVSEYVTTDRPDGTCTRK